MTDTVSLETSRRDLSLNCLKFIAAAAMLIDHIAFAFVPHGTAPAIVMHFIGRITDPPCSLPPWRDTITPAVSGGIFCGWRSLRA